MTGEQKWGERGEQEKAAEKARKEEELERLLEGLSPGARESGRKMLQACEKDFETWAHTSALLVLARACLRFERLGKERTMDVLWTTLKFYRLAVLADSAKFWQGMLEGQEERAMLAFAHNDALERMRGELARLKLLAELGEGEGS
jgi:hypothetical protein